MSNLIINLTDKERQEFLEKRGYKIETIQCWKSENEYHGKVSFHDVDIEVAYKPTETNIDDLKDTNEYKTKQEFGYYNVYQNELALLVKKMILNYE